MNNTVLARSMLIYAICLPLALILGYIITGLSTSPQQDSTSYILFGLLLFVLMSPLLLRWYHAWLIVVLNMGMTIAFLPGYLPGWMPVACIAFGVAVGHYVLNRERKFLSVPAITYSLLFIGIVVLVTAKCRGGLAFRALGDETVGGKRYLYIFVAILGYFALVSQRIPIEKANFYIVLFLFSGIGQAISDLGGYLGSGLGPLSLIFPSSMDPSRYQTVLMSHENLERFGGLGSACVAVAFTVVARYGIEGTLNIRKFWRPLVFFSAACLSFIGGFRGTVVMLVATMALVFCFEGLLRSRLMPVMLLGLMLAGGLTVACADRLPLPVQRCLALLPVKIDPVARMSAETSTKWRLEIWQSVLPQIPHYLLLGKGLTFDMNDMMEYLTFGNGQVGGLVGGGFTLASDYHNGPLSLIIPFGIWGMIGFLWFLVASIKVLWANYKYGDPDLKKINSFLMAYFMTKTLYFFFIFGGFYGDLISFVALIGFSVSLNGGMAKPALVTRPQFVPSRFRPLPIGRPATGI
ncbi:MAG TPA: O-antigen ligase family protein [Candidatus Angelobacter sp.]|nr:O-antigen ligase family protein [Candidatus Angelobacter sp.]